MNNVTHIADWQRATGDSTAPPVTLSPEDREYLIAKLAEMLVLEYQQEQLVTAPTVAEGPVYNGKEGRLHRTPDPFAAPRRTGSNTQHMTT